ncbi:DsbA family protein [Asticcacaulis sp. EMRT-3]|uniref:DsbA family protein n=1 Tax=Asticcacaulis sp. EMRT-3 TaxID=3040349 RepID=UPI0024AF7384|nr:DsbA family protein [Asticcacaulis sp. EMRT-3]MDI7774060.1 DsbA family protein [Asticcacaulis sp. EMRT-3]
MKHPINAFFRLVSFGGLMGAALLMAACGKPAPTPVGSGDMDLGNPNAKVTVIEYASVTCPHCAEFQKDVMPQLTAKYITPGKIHYIYREFLTPPQDVSAAGILLARCAGKDNYFKVIDQIMASQDEMFSDGTGKNAIPVLRRIGASVGVTGKAFDKCITDPAGLTRIQDNIDTYMKKDGVNSTPTFFINGKVLERHTGTLSDFDDAIQPLLQGK